MGGRRGGRRRRRWNGICVDSIIYVCVSLDRGNDRRKEGRAKYVPSAGKRLCMLEDKNQCEITGRNK